MSFFKISKKILVKVLIFICISAVNNAGAQNDTTLILNEEAVNPAAAETTQVNEITDQANSGSLTVNDTTEAAAASDIPEWYEMDRYNLAGSFTYSLTKIKMNNDLKEVGTDYAGLNHKLSYLLMGTSSGWDVSNLADLSFSQWRVFGQNRFMVDIFRLEAVKGDITINTGDFYPGYSGITLEGLTVRGLGFKRVFNERLIIQAFIAQSQKAVEPVREDVDGNSIIDQGEDNNGNNILDVKEGVFSQHMLAGRVENKFCGFFNAGADIISGKDDMSSISNPQSVDSASILYPVLKNNVFGVDGHLHFFDDRLKIDSEYGESNYLKGDNDTTFKDQASNIKLSFLSKIWLTKMVYQKVDPNYHSQGNPYLETDKKGYDLENEFILSKEYSFAGNYEKYNNNVNKLDKDTTIVTRQQEFKLKYYPGQGSKEFKYKNTVKNGNRPYEKDTNDDTYAITVRKDYSEETWITYNLQYSKYQDRLLDTNDYAGYSGYFTWNWDIKKDRLNLVPYFNYNLYKYKNIGQKQVYYLTNIQSRIVLWENRWVLIPYIGYDYMSQNGSKVLEKFSRDIESKFYLSNNISFSIKYGILDNNDENNILDHTIEKVGGEITAVF